MIHSQGPLQLALVEKQEEFSRDPEILAACTYLRRGDVAIDVGANVGMWTTMLSKAVAEEGHVYAFEPHPGNFEQLTNNVCDDGLGNVICYPCAIGADEEPARLFLRDHCRGHRLWGEGQSISIDKTSLDEVFDTSARVNFLKINVLGLETEVLRGGENLIRRQESMAMCVQCWDDLLRAAGSSQEELIDLIFDLGFTVYMHQIAHAGDGDWNAILVHADREYCVNNAATNDFVNLWCVK